MGVYLLYKTCHKAKDHAYFFTVVFPAPSAAPGTSQVFFSFLAAWWGLQDLSSLTRDWTHILSDTLFLSSLPNQMFWKVGCLSEICVCVCMLSCVRLFATPWTVTLQAPLSVGFPRQEYWSGLPFPTPRDLLDPGIEPLSLASPELAGCFFTTSPPGKPKYL